MPVDISQLPEWHTKRIIANRQERYIEGRVNGLTAKEAAAAAGYAPHVAKKPFKLIETPELRRRMQMAMVKSGGIKKIAETVGDALSANVTASFEGNVTESVVPDHKVRVQAAKLAADLMGITERSAASVGASSITLTLSGPIAEALASKLAPGPQVIEGERP